MKWGLRDGGRRIGAHPSFFACHAAPASARHCLLARRGVRAGLRSTIGNRVYVNSVPRVRISPSPPVFFRLIQIGSRTAATPPTPSGPKGSSGNGCGRVSGSLKAQGSLCLHLLCARVHTARAHRRSRMLPRCGRFRTGQPEREASAYHRHLQTRRPAQSGALAVSFFRAEMAGFTLRTAPRRGPCGSRWRPLGWAGCTGAPCGCAEIRA